MSLAGVIKEMDLKYAYGDEDNKHDEENQKKAANLRKDMRAWMKEHHPKVSEDTVYVPKFILKSGIRKWGNGVKRVQAQVLIIDCQATETLYLKQYLEF
eukprot:4823067-Ditylum_brightwellii.AAC.1